MCRKCGAEGTVPRAPACQSLDLGTCPPVPGLVRGSRASDLRASRLVCTPLYQLLRDVRWDGGF